MLSCRRFALICFCSLLPLLCFLLNAWQKVTPTDIHSTASSSGLEVADALASALWCSTVRITGSVQHMEETQKKKISHTRFADFRIAHPRMGPAKDRSVCLFCARAVRFRTCVCAALLSPLRKKFACPWGSLCSPGE